MTKLHELIAEFNQMAETQETTGFPNSAKFVRWCAEKLEAALAECGPYREQIIEIDEDGKVHGDVSGFMPAASREQKK